MKNKTRNPKPETRISNLVVGLRSLVFGRLSRSRGLTLIEVLVGMTIMLIALIPLIIMIAGGAIDGRTGGGGSGTFTVLRRTRNVSKAVFIAQEILDEHVRILRNGFSGICTNCGTDATCAPATCPSSYRDYDEAPFKWSTEVWTTFSQGGIPDSSGNDPGTVKTIKITVWRDDNGNNTQDNFEDSYTLNTKVTSREKNP